MFEKKYFELNLKYLLEFFGFSRSIFWFGCWIELRSYDSFFGNKV